MRGKQRSDMEQARLTAYYASLIHSTKRLKLSDFGLFAWEDEKDYLPRFGPIDKEALARFSEIKFPGEE